MASEGTGTVTHLRTCPLCEAMCGLEIKTTGDQVTSVRGDRDDVWSKGYLCPKGAALGQPAPRSRPAPGADGPRRRSVARGRLGRGVRALRGTAATDRRAVRHRRGDCLHRQSGGPQLLTEPLHRRGRRHPSHAGHLVGRHRRSVAQEPGLRAALRKPLEHPDPGSAAHRSLRGDGRKPARVAGIAVLVPRHPGRDQADPRNAADARSSSTRGAPGPPSRPTSGSRSSPAWMRRSCSPIVHVLDAEGLVSLGALTGRVQGIDEVLRGGARLHPGSRWPRPAACRPNASGSWPASSHQTERAVVYGRIGLCNQEFGTLASWAVDVVNVLTGHLDVERRRDVPDPGHRDHLPDRAPPRPGAGPVAGTPGCARLRRCSARRRSRAWPRRSRRPGEGRVRGADHDGRQPGAVSPRCRPARGSAARCSTR